MRTLAIALILVACNSGPPAPGGETPSPPSPSTPTCNLDAIRSCYGTVKTVAGAGKIGKRGENGWNPAFEGGAATDAELSRPHFAMADAAGNIYIADKDAHAIRRVSPNGSIDTIAGTGVAGDDGDAPRAARTSRLSSPNGLWVKPDGTLYVLDLGNSKVRRISADGQMTTLFQVHSGIGIGIGRGLWISDDESTAFVASGFEILKWTRGLEAQTFASGFSSLGNLVVDPDGDVIATDRGAGQVFRIDDQGSKHLVAGNGQSSGGGDGSRAIDSALPGVRAVWLDGSGGMFVGTHESSHVWYITAAGTLQRFLDDSEVSEVRGLSLDARDNVIIVDDDRGFIRVVPREH